jgi:hypothetical protein
MKSASDKTLRRVGDGAVVAGSGFKFRCQFEIEVRLSDFFLRAKRKIGPLRQADP